MRQLAVDYLWDVLHNAHVIGLRGIEDTMTGQSAFIPEEWELLIAGILQPALAVSMVERGGTLVEMLALYDALAEELKVHVGYPVLGALLTQLLSRKAVDALRAYDRIDYETLALMSLNTLRDALALMVTKANADEVSIYKAVVRELVQRVAEANVEGSSAVSENEAGMIAEIELVLSDS
ncbi:MAG: hypothetical protein KME04_19680 [Pleurocapsa minor GSE-CHR-MK-17-07R]|jgi:hypothetical protein|nr:hypothetical protein [Pleurocapsa minor GSE-CHR-MK 17-07R]